MNQIATKGIILSRHNFSEADRILTVLTPKNGKVRLIAKGVRKSTSKLAGGIELFSVCELTYIIGKGDIHTLISTRLIRHFGYIVQDLERTMLGYGLLKTLHKNTEDASDEEYFYILESALGGLGDARLSIGIVRCWLQIHLLKLGGHIPNFYIDPRGERLRGGDKFSFNYSSMTFEQKAKGIFTIDHIKLLRLFERSNKPQVIGNIRGVDSVIEGCEVIISNLSGQYGIHFIS